MGLLQLENNPLILKGSGGTSLPTATITYANDYKIIRYTNSQGVYTTVTPNGVAGEITDALKDTLILVQTTSGGTRPIGSGVTFIGQLYGTTDGLVEVCRIDSTSVSFVKPAASGGTGN